MYNLPVLSRGNRNEERLLSVHHVFQPKIIPPQNKTRRKGEMARTSPIPLHTFPKCLWPSIKPLHWMLRIGNYHRDFTYWSVQFSATTGHCDCTIPLHFDIYMLYCFQQMFHNLFRTVAQLLQQPWRHQQISSIIKKVKRGKKSKFKFEMDNNEGYYLRSYI